MFSVRKEPNFNYFFKARLLSVKILTTLKCLSPCKSKLIECKQQCHWTTCGRCIKLVVLFWHFRHLKPISVQYFSQRLLPHPEFIFSLIIGRRSLKARRIFFSSQQSKVVVLSTTHKSKWQSGLFLPCVQKRAPFVSHSWRFVTAVNDTPQYIYIV